MLRTHTSAHQSTLISGGEAAFICTGDVYRRDEIDATHYPVFHQMEGVRIFQDKDLPAGTVDYGKAWHPYHLHHHHIYFLISVAFTTDC